MNRTVLRFLAEAAAVVLVVAVFVGPLLFVLFNAAKTAPEAAAMAFQTPSDWSRLVPNVTEVTAASDFMILRALFNSTLLTVLSIVVLVLVSSLAGFVLERRAGRVTATVSFFVLVGLMIPPSVITTIWVLQGVALYKTLAGLVLVEVALGFPFAVLLYRAFMVTVPRELDEAAFLEGANGRQVFVRVIFPVLQSVSATIIVLSAVNVFNDFVNPLYFLPGAKNVTVQLTLYNFMTRYSTQWNLLFTNVLLLTIPPLLLYIFFNKQIVAGMVAGAVKS